MHSEHTLRRMARARAKGWQFYSEQKRRATTEELFELLWKPNDVEREEAFLLDLLSVDAFRCGEQLAIDGSEEPAS